MSSFIFCNDGNFHQYVTSPCLLSQEMIKIMIDDINIIDYKNHDKLDCFVHKD